MAEVIQARRRALGRTQAVLAERLGVSANTLARWERGELRITRDRVDSAMDGPPERSFGEVRYADPPAGYART